MIVKKRNNLNVLFLVQEEQKSIFDNWYDDIVYEIGQCDLIKVSTQEQKNLKHFIYKSNIDLNNYDRVILFLRYKKMMKQVAFIQTIPGLVILELDGCQNYCKDSKYYKKFSQYFSELPWVKILCTGKQLARNLREEGFDALSFNKCYDPEIVYDMQLERDIEIAFIGTFKSGVYSTRKKFLLDLQDKINLKIIKTTPGREYRETLNRIKFFINTDETFCEYMIKNFEAMGCGCVLFTYDQGSEENQSTGFEDMKNVVFFKNQEELIFKLELLKKDEELCRIIAENAKKLVLEKHTWNHAAKKVSVLINTPIRKKWVKKSFFGILKKYTYSND